MRRRALGGVCWSLLVLALALTSLVAVPGHRALAQPNRVTLTLEGHIIAIGTESVEVYGEITALHGAAGDWEAGDWVTLTVILAGRFQNAAFDVSDDVIVSGTLLADGETLRATRVQLLDEADDDEDKDEGDDEGEREGCTGADPHPAAEKLADAFDVESEWVMDWFCDGFGFGEIKLALRIAENAENVTADDLLDEKSGGKGWGQIIRGQGLSPSQVNPGLGVGKPDDQGRPDNPGSQGRGQGRGSKK